MKLTRGSHLNSHLVLSIKTPLTLWSGLRQRKLVWGLSEGKNQSLLCRNQACAQGAFIESLLACQVRAISDLGRLKLVLNHQAWIKIILCHHQHFYVPDGRQHLFFYFLNTH